MLLGLRSPYTQQPLLATAFADLVYAALVAAAVYGAWRSRKHDASLLYAVVVAFPLIYAISPQTLLEQVPRYLLVLSPVLALLVAQLATTRTRVFAVLAAAAVVSVVTLHRMDTWASTVPPDPPIAPRNLQPLIRTLDRLGVDHVYATYWLAYRLDFDSRERIVTAENRLIAVSFAGNRGVPATDPHIRYPAYARKVAADPRHGFVFFDREPGAERRIERARVQAALAAHGYVPHRVSIFTVYAPRQ